MEFIIPDTPASIEQGLTSDAAKRWDETEKLNRERNMQQALSELHHNQTALTAAVTISMDEDSEDTFSADAYENSSSLQKHMSIANMSNSESFTDSNKENNSRYDSSHLSSDIIPQDPPTPYLSTGPAHAALSIQERERNAATNNVNSPVIHPLTQTHIQSLEFQVTHLQTQNYSLRNTITRDQHTLEHLSYSNSQAVEQLNLMKAHFQHLLPPPSSDSDPSLSTSDCILPTLPELRGEQLHRTKMDLTETKQELKTTRSQLNHIKQEYNDQMQTLTTQNKALESQLENLHEELRQSSFIKRDSPRHLQYQSQDHILVEKHMEKKIHVLEGQLFVLTQNKEGREKREEEQMQKITSLQYTKDHQNDKIKSLTDQQRKDQFEIAALLEQRNALRGQLDEIQLQSHSNGKSLDSQFQEEIHRLQTSHSKSKRHMQDQVSSLQTMLNEKTKLWKESQENESSTLRTLQDYKRGSTLLIQTLLQLEEEKLLFQSKNTMTVKEMINYAWKGLKSINSEHLLINASESGKEKWNILNVEHIDISTQTSSSNKSSGTNTNETEMSQIQKEHQKVQQIEIQNLLHQNHSLENSNQMLQDQLQLAMDENQKFSSNNSALIDKMDSISQESKTLQKSKKYVQEENRKLVQQSVDTKDLLVSVKKENEVLKEKIKSNKDKINEKSNNSKKIQKMKKEIEHIGQERDYWEKTASDYKTQLKPEKDKTKDFDKILPTISFDQSSIITYDTEKGSLSMLESPHIAQPDSHKAIQMSKKESNNMKDQQKHINDLKTALTEKETIITALTEHIDTKSRAIGSSSPYSTLDNDKIPLEIWLQSWESTMDQNVKETTETVTNALSSALHMLVDDLLPQNINKDTAEENEVDIIDNDMEKHVENVAMDMAEALQEGLQMIQNFARIEEKKEKSQPKADFKKDGEALEAKLKQLLGSIDNQQAKLRTRDLFIDTKNQKVYTKLQTTIQDKSHGDFEIKESINSVSKDATETIKVAGKIAHVADSNSQEKNTDGNLKEKLLEFLQNIDEQSNQLELKPKTSDIATEIDIIPGMVTKGTDASSPTAHTSVQTNTDPVHASGNYNTLREQLTKAVSECSQLLCDKESLEIDLANTKKSYQCELHKVRQDKESEIKFYKLHLDSSFPLRQIRNNSKEDEITMQDRLYRIRQSAERAALISKHEEEQAVLIAECNTTLRSKIDSFNKEVSKAVEKNIEEVKKDRDEFIQFACTELKREYNHKIESLFQRHQQEIGKAKAEPALKYSFKDEEMNVHRPKHNIEHRSLQKMSEDTPSMEESIDVLRKRHNEMRSAMKSKLEQKKFSSQKKSKQSYLPFSKKDEEKNSALKNVDVRTQTSELCPKPQLEDSFFEMINTTPRSQVAVNLFQNEQESSTFKDKESFQDVEDFVVGVLNDCEITKRLSLTSL